jgi:hypothetical protein
MRANCKFTPRIKKMFGNDFSTETVGGWLDKD